MKIKNNKQSFCVVSATKILGDKWTPRIIVALLDSEKGFCDIQYEVIGINPRTLSLRLNSLCENGIIRKIFDSAAHPTYKLTKMGEDLFPILNDMVAWGKKYAK